MKSYEKYQKVMKWLEKMDDQQLKAQYDALYPTVDRESVIEGIMEKYKSDDRACFELSTAAGISVEDLD